MVIATVEWKIKYLCADMSLYFVLFIKKERKTERVELKPVENNPVWWKAKNYKSGQIPQNPTKYEETGIIMCF